ncbi:N-acetylmuramate alpha-1-phosphate uridylyltransferase MurU [Bacterioplanes sanyensis]|uniref:N-acetylmuramate alpha-1-phosphate uridylyltransferase MurU n=1 Tax=Bacterioplanes sanyensis TaxID=1249553 RepID=UPI0027E584E7|nr:nucleotidyltransferase family protein [Bacterioplanes sanyensis]
MILAAGRGTRMGSLTDHCPKPLLSVGQQTLIEHHIAALAAMGINDVVINISYLADRIRQHLGAGERWSLRLHYSYEPEALETAGGIVKALPLLGSEPFLLVNGDVFLAQGHPQVEPLAAGDLAHLWLVDNPEHHPEGDFGLRQGRVVSTEIDRLTFSGVSLLHPDLFAGMAPGPQRLAPVLQEAINSGRVSGEYWQNAWLDVGTPERLQQARALCG